MTKLFKERTKKFTFAPFPYALTVVVSNDIHQSIIDRIPKYGLSDPSDDMAACVYDLGGRCLMFMPEGADMEWLVHESSHVVWFMLHHAGVSLDKEVLAYYTGHLSKQVAVFAWKLTKKKNQKV